MVTGWKASGELHAKTDYTGKNGSSHGTSSDLTRQGSHSKGFSAQELKDFRDAMDVVSSTRVTDNSSHTDNASGSLVNQLASTFSTLNSQASQYNDAVTRSHEYAQLASYAENNQASIQQNYAQEFVGYVREQRQGDADMLLSDTANAEVRAEREKLVQAFVDERLKPQLLQQFEQNRAQTGAGMGSVTIPEGMSTDLSGEFSHQQSAMEAQATQHGVKGESVVSGHVVEQRNSVEADMRQARENVNSAEKTTVSELEHLKKEYEQGNKNFEVAKAAEELRQSVRPDKLLKGEDALVQAMDEIKKNNR
ncbi:hypothetical protein FG467_004444 [Yersinia enterocolitica]|nr:hypothetical protein [Yersinia enterocolitica]EKN5956404.1 hypothetical protein [Yersinia enterocolitica]